MPTATCVSIRLSTRWRFYWNQGEPKARIKAMEQIHRPVTDPLSLELTDGRDHARYS
jgi:hypothetical protein